MVDPDQARYARERLFATATGGGERHSIQVDLIRGTGTVRSRAEGSSLTKAPFACKEGCRIDDPVSDRVEKGVPPVMTRLGVPVDDVKLQFVPDLIFKMEAENRIWQVTYQMEHGSVEARPIDETGEPLSTRRFLTGLHLAHSFPSQLNASWFWAIVVDAMFVSMMLWAISGLLMWWQLKALRRWGVLALALSAVMTTALVIGMYRVLAS